MTLCFTYADDDDDLQTGAEDGLVQFILVLSSSAYVKHSVTTCGSKCNFSCYCSTFTILSTLFLLNSLVFTTYILLLYQLVCATKKYPFKYTTFKARDRVVWFVEVSSYWKYFVVV